MKSKPDTPETLLEWALAFLHAATALRQSVYAHVCGQASASPSDLGGVVISKFDRFQVVIQSVAVGLLVIRPEPSLTSLPHFEASRRI